MRSDGLDLLLRMHGIRRRRGARRTEVHDCARYVFGFLVAIATRSYCDAATRLEDSSLDSLGVRRSFCLVHSDLIVINYTVLLPTSSCATLEWNSYDFASAMKVQTDSGPMMRLRKVKTMVENQI